MKKKILSIIRSFQLIISRVGVKFFFKSYFNEIAKGSGLDFHAKLGEDYNNWRRKWTICGDTPLPLIYRVYDQFISEHKANIVPNDIARNYFEPILTPFQYQPFYNDKNSLNLIIDESDMPRTLFRSMNNHLLDNDYEPIEEGHLREHLSNASRIIVKPTMNMGGRGVTLFSLRDYEYIDGKGNKLSKEYLAKHFGANYIVQEYIEQSEFMSQFNPSSVNTLRIATYRDVNTGEISVIGAVMRMGGVGSLIDNACSGGVFISVSNDGILGDYVCDEFGRKRSIHNGIDFEQKKFIIPDYEDILQFVIRIAKRLPHMSLLANDVAITKDGRPILIEVNTQMFSYWLYQQTGNTVFGQKTESLIEYCTKNCKKIVAKKSLYYIN